MDGEEQNGGGWNGEGVVGQQGGGVYFCVSPYGFHANLFIYFIRRLLVGKKNIYIFGGGLLPAMAQNL